LKRALLLLALAACSRSRKPASCEQVCDRPSELATAELEQTMARIADHSDEATRDNLRARGAEAREAEHDRCVERCDAGEVDKACMIAATTFDATRGCFKD
jgi:hypothetical protein